MDISSLSAKAYLPPQAGGASPEEAALRRALAAAAKDLNAREFFGPQNELVFSVDQASRRTVVRVVDRNTREILMQLPAEYVLRLAADSTRKL